MLKLRTILAHQDARQLRILGHMVKVKAEDSYSIEVNDSCSDSSKLYQSIMRNAPSLILMEESLFTPCINSLVEKMELVLITGDKSKVDTENIHYVYLPVQPVTIMKKITEIVESSQLIRDTQGPKAFLNSLHFPRDYSSAVDFYVESKHLTWQFGINYIEQRHQIYHGLEMGEFSPEDKEQEHADTSFDPASIINPALRNLWDDSSQQSGYNPNPTPQPRAPKPARKPPEPPPVPSEPEPVPAPVPAPEPVPEPPAAPAAAPVTTPSWAMEPDTEPVEEAESPMPDNRWVKPAKPPAAPAPDPDPEPEIIPEPAPPTPAPEPPTPIPTPPPAPPSPPPPAEKPAATPPPVSSSGGLPAPPTPEELEQMMQMMQTNTDVVPSPAPTESQEKPNEENLTKFTFISSSQRKQKDPIPAKTPDNPPEPPAIPSEPEPAPIPEPPVPEAAPVPPPAPNPAPVPPPVQTPAPVTEPKSAPVTPTNQVLQTPPVQEPPVVPKVKPKKKTKPTSKLEPLPQDIPNPGDVVSMEWEHYPEKTDYVIGEVPEISDGVVAAIHADGTRELISLQDDMIRHIRYTIGEPQMGTVVIYGFTLQIPLNYSGKNRISGIRISSAPNKCVYKEGEHFDLTGFAMEKVFSDGTVAPLTNYRYVDEPLTLEQQVIPFFYGRRKVNLLIRVLPLHEEKPKLPELDDLLASIPAPEVKQIELRTMPRTKYGRGEPFEPEKGSVHIVYDNGTDEVVPLTIEMLSGLNMEVLGEQTIDVSVGGKTCPLTLNIIRKKKRKGKTQTSTVEPKAETTLPPKPAQPTPEPTTIENSNPAPAPIPDNSPKAQPEQQPVPPGQPEPEKEPTSVEVPDPIPEPEPVPEPAPRELVSISLAGSPKSVFSAGEKVSIHMYPLLASYSDDTSEQVAPATVEPTSISADTKTLTFTYQDKTVQLPITITGKQLITIMLDSPPHKMEYVLGEKSVDMTGAKATLFYSDSSFESVDIPDEWVQGFDGSKAGKQNLRIVHQGKEAAFTVVVADRAVESINISKMPMKIKYHEGDVFDPSGMEVAAKYNDGYFGERVPFTYDKSPLKADTNHVTIFVGDKSASVFVEVSGSAISRIAMEALPVKTVYLEGEKELDPSGALVAKFSSTGEKEIVPLSTCQYTGFTSLKAGNCRILVTSDHCTCEFEVSIIRRELVSLRIASMPVKTIYNDGDIFDPTGLVLAAEYNDRTSANVTNYVVASKVLSLDDTEIAAQFETMAVKIPITVRGRQIDSIVIASMPNKVSYLEHQDELDMTGGKLMVIYADGESSIIDITNSMVTGFNNTVIGENVVTVHYCNSTVEMSLQIASAQLIGISIQKNPNKLSYQAGEFFDKTGMEIVAFFNNGQQQSLSYYSILPETPLTEKDSSVQIIYMNKTATLPITVQAPVAAQTSSLPVMEGFYPDTEDLRFDDEDDEEDADE